MKKIIMLFAAAIFLYGAPNVYAETKIHPGMSVDEIKAVLEEHGISLAPPPDSTTDIAEDAATPSTVDQSQALPPYVKVDNSNPVHTTGPCSPPPSPSFSVTGWDMGFIMGPFPVTAVTNQLSSPETVNWVAVGPPAWKAGVAVGDGWLLFEQGDTWNNNWWIITDANVVVSSIKIDAWNKIGGSNKHAVFDIIHGPIVTPGSANGLPFTKVPPGWPTNTNVVYSTPVLGTPNDLYGVMTINFPSGFSGAAPLGGFLMFKADTDCMPVQEVLLNSYDGTTLNFTVVGEGAVAITKEDGSVVQGPFVVERGEGQNTFTTQFTPKANSCYVMTDIDTGTVMTDKYCF
ncbi:hypothetical protein THII_2958 [Thioploca ingrica]|uniref:Uncharacterized protein n=1 Tax=Thioploca ingrica TaxID=40754 RepID=A0A090AP40_9GAMM|nr:hypothetical protein THII_2958 [Thioploca ingrica]